MCNAEHLPDAALADGQETAVSKSWVRSAYIGNLALGAAELVTGNTATLSVAVDGVHNVGDGIAYKMQGDDILSDSTDIARLQSRRKAVYWIISASSALVGVKAGLDLSQDISHEANNASMYAAGASLLFNGALFARFRQGVKRRRDPQDSVLARVKEHDLHKHFIGFDIPSAGLALFGVAAQRHGMEYTEQAAAAFSSLLGLYHFRPTKWNLRLHR